MWVLAPFVFEHNKKSCLQYVVVCKACHQIRTDCTAPQNCCRHPFPFIVSQGDQSLLSRIPVRGKSTELVSGNNVRSGKELSSGAKLKSEVKSVAVGGPAGTPTDGPYGHSLVQWGSCCSKAVVYIWSSFFSSAISFRIALLDCSRDWSS